MDGNRTNQYLYHVFCGLFFDFIFASVDRTQTKCKKQSHHTLYGEEQSADRTACESADSDQIDFSNDHGFIDYFIVYTAAEWKNEPDRASFFESYSAQISGGIWGVYFVFLYLLFCYCQRYEQIYIYPSADM